MRSRDVLLFFIILMCLVVLSHAVKGIMPVRKITGDGNCWYRSLSVYQQDNEDDHFDLRQIVVNYMSQNRDRYWNLDTSVDIDRFINNQRVDREYAEDAVLQASADLFQICIYVTVRHLDGECVTIYRLEPTQNQNETRHWLHVEQTGYLHFDVLGYSSPTRNYGTEPRISVPWYDRNSNLDRSHAGVGDKKKKLCVQNSGREEDEMEETSLRESDIASCMNKLDIRGGSPGNTEKDESTAKNINLMAKRKLKLPNLQPSSDINLGLTIPVKESEDSDYDTPLVSPIEEKNTEQEFKTPPQSPVKNVEKLSDVLTRDGDLNEVVESMPDEVDGEIQEDLKGDNNKKDNSYSDNPVYTEIGSIDDLIEQSRAGGLSWTHFKVYRKFWGFHHHFLVVNSEEKGIIVVHLHPKIENLKVKIICEQQNISFCDNKTWCGLLDFEAGLTIVKRTSYPDIQSETELFDRVQEVLGYEDYSLIDECNFYCETLVTYILTGRKLSTEIERYKKLYPKTAITAIYIVESFMGFYRNKFVVDIVYQIYNLLSALHADDQDYYYHLSNIISCTTLFIRMYFYIQKQRKGNE